MKTNKPSSEIDLFTPFYEIFHEICLLLVTLVGLLMKWGFKKAFNTYVPVKAIERKALTVKKTTDLDESLGIDVSNKKPILLKSLDTRRHTFIAGSSGFGKTNLMSILQEDALSRGRPIIFFDPKGDMEALTTFQAICQKYQRPCYIFSEHFPDSISLNPLIDGTVNQVVDRIMRAFKWENSFYESCAWSALMSVCQSIEKEEETISFKEITKRLVALNNKDIAGLVNQLEKIQKSDFGRILNSGRDGLTLAKIRQERACLYIGLSTQGYGETASAIGKIFLGELLFNSYHSLKSSNAGLRLANPISVHFDEFGSLVIPEFINLQNKCRGAGIELTMAVQSIADIDAVSEQLTSQIVENCGNLFVFKQRVQKSAEYFSQAIGTTLTRKETHRIDNGEIQAQGSAREVNEMLVHPDIIKNLNVGQCVLLRQAPSQINLINVRERKAEVQVQEKPQVQRKPGAFEQ